MGQTKTVNIVVSGTNMWNPGDDFVRDGVITILRALFAGKQLNFLFYNFNQDFFPQSKFSGITNMASQGDLDRYRDSVDAVVIAGLSAGTEIKDLYSWVIANHLEDRVYMIGAGYENAYVERYIYEEPEATIFRNARIITGRTRKTPKFIPDLGLPYHYINCPAILSVPSVKAVEPGHKLTRIGMSLQLPHEHGIVNHCCSMAMYELGVQVLLSLKQHYEVEVVAHHKSEYFHFINLLKGHDIPVLFSSFYEDLHDIYPRYDLMVTTRLHASLFANGFGIPGIIINDTDRHTHCLEGFPHSVWVNNAETFTTAFQKTAHLDLHRVAEEAAEFKKALLQQYLEVLHEPFGVPLPGGKPATKGLPASGKAVLLNISGGDYRPGFINIGSKATTGKKVDLELDLENERLTDHFREDGAELILANNILQYRSRREAERMLEDFHYVLSPNGVVQITVPDAEAIINAAELSIDSKITMLFGEDVPRQADSTPRQHDLKGRMYGWTSKAMQSALTETGFENVSITRDDNSFIATATKKKSASGTDVREESETNSLPIHFFTIVLNGEPFIRHHIDVFQKLPFEWHWHIIEGVADLKHDTAWSLANGGRITDSLHCAGRSNDGTSEYLDQLAASHPDKISLYRKPKGVFWDGKLEMVSAPLQHLQQKCLLWQVDADELWLPEQICRTREIFLSRSEASAAYFLCNYFVGEDLVITTRNTYGNNSYEWLRCWRYAPGDRWQAHEPPRLCRKIGDRKWVDVATLAPVTRDQTEAQGLVFQHFAYATAEQVRFKEDYYGYQDATRKWEVLQAERSFPVYLRDYFQWVHDAAVVDTVESKGLHPIAGKGPDGTWRFNCTGVSTLPSRKQQRRDQAGAGTVDLQRSGIKKILFARPDSIGDNVMAASMLPHIKAKFPHAEIVVLCQQHVAEIYEASPYVSSVVGYSRAKATKDERYREMVMRQIKDVAADLMLNSLYSRDPLYDLLSLASCAPLRVAFHGDLCNISAEERQQNDRLYSTLILSNGLHKPEMERHRDFLRSIGCSAPELQPLIWCTPEDEAAADAFFTTNQLVPERTIALYASDQWGFKSYPHYKEVLAEICRERDFALVAFGAQHDLAFNQAILDGVGAKSINMSGKTTLRQAAAIVRRCRAGIGADTGIAHIACAVGTPHVVMLGGGHFGRFFPYSRHSTVVSLPLSCYQCNWHCRYSTPHCITNLDPEVVAKAFIDTLDVPSDKPRLYLEGQGLWSPLPGEPAWKGCYEYVDSAAFDVKIISGKGSKLVVRDADWSCETGTGETATTGIA